MVLCSAGLCRFVGATSDAWANYVTGTPRIHPFDNDKDSRVRCCAYVVYFLTQNRADIEAEQPAQEVRDGWLKSAKEPHDGIELGKAILNLFR